MSGEREAAVSDVPCVPTSLYWDRVEAQLMRHLTGLVINTVRREEGGEVGSFVFSYASSQ